MTDALVAPSARELTRDYMMAELTARSIPNSEPTAAKEWTTAVPATRPDRFFTIEDLNSADAFGFFADSQLIQIRAYDPNGKRLSQTMRLIKGLWKVMPTQLEVQSVEIAGGPTYDEDPDVDGLYYGQIIAWVNVMTTPG